MSGGGLFLQTPNHPLKWYFVLLRWPSPPLESGSMDHCKPPSEAALPEKSGGPGSLGMLFDFFVGFLLIFGYVLDFLMVLCASWLASVDGCPILQAVPGGAPWCQLIYWQW
ncbi:hypothetical protein HanPI659440_Chr07g0264711 [Helianthus annuus]|nr:hypothetical protein HanPI659440_Chr07g0264711 [Helianthus annuus]